MPKFEFATPGNEVVSAYADRVPGKTILITGPSEGGIGALTAIFFAAAKPAQIILAGRSKGKIQPVIDQISQENPDVSTKFVQLDLADLASVRKAAQEVKALTKKLDILVNNAGVMAIEEYTKSKDGIEYQFAANHIELSMYRVISGGVHFDDPNFKNGKEYNPWLAYSQAKTANILFATALAAKLKSKGVYAFSLNPGFMPDTKLMSNITPEMFADGHRIANEALKGAPMPEVSAKPLAAGASTTLYGALDPDLKNHSGAFLNHAAVWEEELLPHATGADKAEKLWALSEKLVGQKFSY